jgi:dipeptidyl aminopeptidase/acylaminoacyl peptidase
MIMRGRGATCVSGLWLLILCILWIMPAASAAPPPFDPGPRAENFAFSPDGSRLAWTTPSGSEWESLQVGQLADGSVRKLALLDRGIVSLQWSGDGRHLLALRDADRGVPVQRIDALALDTTPPVTVPLVPADVVFARLVSSLSPDGRVLLALARAGERAISLYSVSVQGGDLRLEQAGTADTLAWYADADGRPLARLDRVGDHAAKLHFLDRAGAPDMALPLPAASPIFPGLSLFIGDAARDSVWLRLYPGAGAPLQRRRIADGQLLESVGGNDSLASVSIFGRQSGRLLLAQLDGDETTLVGNDANLLALARQAIGPDPVIMVDMTRDAVGHHMIITSDNGQERSLIWLDRADNSHHTLIRTPSPWRGLVTQAVSIPLPDGGVLGGWLLRRAAGTERPAPLLIRLSGQIQRRSVWGADGLSRTLAGNGFSVLLLDVRGTLGRGAAYAQPGGVRLAAADAQAAARWAVSTGLAASGQVVLLGEGVAGHAALLAAMGPSDLAAVAVTDAVTDVPGFLVHLQTSAPFLAGSYRPWFTGWDAAGDPLRRAAEVRVPVLLMHGLADRTVPIAQGRGLANALTAAGRPVTLLEMDDPPYGEPKPGRFQTPPTPIQDLLVETMRRQTP